MAEIHFLNVRQGDCSLIKHNTGHHTVIDVCNAKPPDPINAAIKSELAKREAAIRGNFQQAKHPVNPVSYLRDHGVSTIFRYIQTHPDMDHMDGLSTLFNEFTTINMWDTDNDKELLSPDWSGSSYNKDDWDFYKHLRDFDSDHDPNRLALLSGSRGQFYNVGDDGSRGGDGLQILAPTQELVDSANEEEEYHLCSYVVLYRTGERKIVFAGDSHNRTWEHILEHYESSVTDVDLLIAPHHGRKSGRSYEFLDILNPAVTFFGNAKSEELAYGAWRSRDLLYLTNNQANCLIANVSSSSMWIYATHEKFVRQMNPRTNYNERLQAWSLCSVP